MRTRVGISSGSISAGPSSASSSEEELASNCQLFSRPVAAVTALLLVLSSLDEQEEHSVSFPASLFWLVEV